MNIIRQDTFEPVPHGSKRRQRVASWLLRRIQPDVYECACGRIVLSSYRCPLPAVPGELIEKAAQALVTHSTWTDWDTFTLTQAPTAECECGVKFPTSNDAAQHQAEHVLAALDLGDIVEAARRDALTTAVGAIEALHRNDGTDWCEEDGFAWPCHTARIVTDLRDATLRSAP